MKFYFRIWNVVTFHDDRSLFFPILLDCVSVHRAIFFPSYGRVIRIYNNFQSARLVQHVHVSTAIPADYKRPCLNKCGNYIRFAVILWNRHNYLICQSSVSYNRFDSENLCIGQP